MTPKRRLRTFAVLTVLILAFAVASGAVAGPGDTTLISRALDGTAGNGDSNAPAISDDGSLVVFESRATNLVAGDTNGSPDVFLYDVQTGETALISKAPDGSPGNGGSYDPGISGNGRYVIYRSFAANLAPGDADPNSDIFVFDLDTGITELVSVASDGTKSNGACLYPAISGDGRFVAFYSTASNLVTGDTNGYADIFVRDRQLGITTRASVSSDGTEADYPSHQVVVSSDGGLVVYFSGASNLVPDDTNTEMDVFVHDLQTRETTRVSVASDGTQANGYSRNPSISVDGRYVAFSSNANNLVQGDTNKQPDIFVHDRLTGETTRVSVTSDGGQANGGSDEPSISLNGRYVTFFSYASNLVPDDLNTYFDIFLHDRQTGSTKILAYVADDPRAYQGSIKPALSGDGRFVVFESDASSLGPNDNNYRDDVFLHEILQVKQYYFPLFLIDGVE